MKRVGSFEVRIQFVDGKHSTKHSKQKSLRFYSWHKTCSHVSSLLNSEHGKNAAQEAVIIDPHTRSVLAKFSNVNLESWSDSGHPRAGRVLSSHLQRSPKQWDSMPFGAGSEEIRRQTRIYENRNVRDFHWELIEGAKREVPFRLSLLERKAEQNLLCRFLLSCYRAFTSRFSPILEFLRLGGR